MFIIVSPARVPGENPAALYAVVAGLMMPETTKRTRVRIKSMPDNES